MQGPTAVVFDLALLICGSAAGATFFLSFVSGLLAVVVWYPKVKKFVFFF